MSWPTGPKLTTHWYIGQNKDILLDFLDRFRPQKVDAVKFLMGFVENGQLVGLCQQFRRSAVDRKRRRARLLGAAPMIGRMSYKLTRRSWRLLQSLSPTTGGWYLATNRDGPTAPSRAPISSNSNRIALACTAQRPRGTGRLTWPLPLFYLQKSTKQCVV